MSSTVTRRRTTSNQSSTDTVDTSVTTSELPQQLQHKKHASQTTVRLWWRFILSEAVAVMLWTTTLLSLIIVTRLSLVPPLFKNFNLAPLTAIMPLLPLTPTPLPFTMPTPTSDDLFMPLLIIAMLIWDTVGLSFGSPLNPAVTLPLTVRRPEFRDGIVLRLFVQFIATIASVFLVDDLFRFDARAHDLLAPPAPHVTAHWMTAAAFEALGTGTLVIISMSMPHFFTGSTGRAQKVRRWLFSTILFVTVVVTTAEWSGACMNPALAFALAILHRDWSAHHVYWIGPLIGASFAAVLHVYVIERTFPLNKEKVDEPHKDDVDVDTALSSAPTTAIRATTREKED